MSQSQRIAVYSVSDLKNTTDDALPGYLKGKKGFIQNYLLTDVRLALGYSAVSIAAVTFYLDYTSTWEKTKGWTLWAVLAYFMLNSALTLWIWGVEKGKVFTGSRGNMLISFASHAPKHQPIYQLKVRHSNAGNQAELKDNSIEIETSFTKWFTTDGQFVAESFYSWLDSKLPFLQQDNSTAKKRLGN